MALIKKGLMGPVTGKVGSLVGSSWRGIEYIKSRPHRTKPPTEGELANRFIFKLTQEWIQPLAPFLRIGFKDYSPTSFGVNAAKSYIYKNALQKDGLNSTIDPARMKVSHGTLPLPDNIQIELDKNYELTFTWDTQAGAGQDPDDQAMLLAYNVDKKDFLATTSGQFRRIGTDKLDLKYAHMGTFHIYAAFISVDRDRRSGSIYLGTVTTEKKV